MGNINEESLIRKVEKLLNEEVLPHNINKVKQLIDEINKIGYFKIDGEDISINKGFGTVSEQIDLQSLAEKFKELGFKVRTTHFQITVYGLKDFTENKNESLNESEVQIYNVEYNYGDGSPGLAIEHVKVRANSEEEALEKAEKYASTRHYRDDSYYIEDSCKIVKSGYSNDPIIESSQKNEDYDEDDYDDSFEEMHKERYAVYFETQEGRQKYTIYHVYTDSTDDSYNELCDKRDNQLGMYNSYKELKDSLKERAEKIAKQQGWTVKSIDNLGEDDEYYRERNKWESLKESRGYNESSQKNEDVLTKDILDNALYSDSFMGDRAYLTADNIDYIKIGKDEWQSSPRQSHALGAIYTTNQLWDKIKTAKELKLDSKAYSKTESLNENISDPIGTVELPIKDYFIDSVDLYPVNYAEDLIDVQFIVKDKNGITMPIYIANGTLDKTDGEWNTYPQIKWNVSHLHDTETSYYIMDEFAKFKDERSYKLDALVKEIIKKLNLMTKNESINEGLAEPTGELAVFAKRKFSNVNGKPEKDFKPETDYRLSLEDAEKWINRDIGYDRPGIVYQIRDKEGNVIKEVKWVDVYNTPEEYDKAIKYLYKYGNMEQIAYVLRLANPDVPQEKIDKRIMDLKRSKDQEENIRNHMYFDGATWQTESVNEEYKSGDKIIIDGKQGIIDSTFIFEDGSILGAWVKLDNDIKYYTIDELNNKDNKNESEENDKLLEYEYKKSDFKSIKDFDRIEKRIHNDLISVINNDTTNIDLQKRIRHDLHLIKSWEDEFYTSNKNESVTYHFSVEDIGISGNNWVFPEEAYKEAKSRLGKLGYKVSDLTDDLEFTVIGDSTGVAYDGVIYSKEDVNESVSEGNLDEIYKVLDYYMTKLGFNLVEDRKPYFINKKYIKADNTNYIHYIDFTPQMDNDQLKYEVRDEKGHQKLCNTYNILDAVDMDTSLQLIEFDMEGFE